MSITHALMTRSKMTRSCGSNSTMSYSERWKHAPTVSIRPQFSVVQIIINNSKMVGGIYPAKYVMSVPTTPAQDCRSMLKGANNCNKTRKMVEVATKSLLRHFPPSYHSNCIFYSLSARGGTRIAERQFVNNS